MSSGRDASSSARRMLAIRFVFCTLSRRPSPVLKKRSRALSRNDRIMCECKVTLYRCQEWPYNDPHIALSIVFWRGFAALHHRADLPGLELVLAEAELLALGLLAASHVQDQLEDALAAFGHALRAVDDGAAIDVHVVGHALVERRVGRELDRGRRLAAEDRAAAGGEADHVRAGSDLARRRYRIVARRVHEHEASGLHRLGVVDHVGEVGGAALGGGPQGLPPDGGEPAPLFAGRGAVVHGAAMLLRIGEPPR